MRNFETKDVARKYFSATMGNKVISSILRTGSMSDKDFDARINVYRKAFANVDDNNALSDSVRKVFAGPANLGYGATDLQGTSQFDASLLANVKSFAGFLACERALTQPNDYVSFLDIVGAYTGDEVEPNLGPADYSGVVRHLDIKGTAVAGTAITPTNTEKVIPRSFSVNFKESSAPFAEWTITDDGKGNLLAPSGKLSAGTINYATGVITFTTTVAGAYDGFAALDKVAAEEIQDDSVLTYRQGGTLLRTTPHLLMSKVNLASAAAMGKSLGVDPIAYMAEQLQIAYIHLLNKNLVKGIKDVEVGNTAYPTIDFTSQSYDTYVSYADWFTSQFTDLDYALADQAAKAPAATAYLVSPDVAAKMTKTEIRGNFKRDENYAYINDLVGYFRGVPVLQHKDVPTGTGYAVFKKDGGEVAPIIRGIYLPITDTPQVGNYNNPTQLAEGLYYQDAVKGIFPQLVKKFTVEGEMGN